MNTQTAASTDNDRTLAVVLSFLFHAAFLAILIFWKIYAPDKPSETPAIVLDWGGGGDNAALGEPDQGMNSTDPSKGDDGSEAETPEESEPESQPSKPAPPSPSKPAKNDSKVEVPKNTPTSDDPESAAVKKAREETKRKEREEADAKRREKEAADAVNREKQRQADEAAEKKRQADEAAKKKKGSLADDLKNGGGKGKGNGGKQGNQGSPNGDPDGDNPFGKDKGKGGGTGGGDGVGDGSSVGGGLGGRKVTNRPKVSDNSQKEGRVRIQVCVDASGAVVSATPTQSGSTTTDGELRAIAVAAAKKYKFAASGSEKECGWIDFNFKLQ